MRDFENRCIALGVANETIHGPEHARFWADALFYYTQRYSADNAAERYVKVKTPSVS